MVARYRIKNRSTAPEVKRPFWEFRDVAGASETELYLYEEIGFSWFNDGVTAAGFAKDLAEVKTKNLTLRVNSPGGDVFDGVAIANLIREFNGTVTAKVDSLAASIASVIVMAADVIIMGPQSQMMIHDASGYAMGNPADMREMADLLDMISDNIAGAYAAKAGGTAASWRKVMTAETWYTADQAVSARLADSVSGAKTDPAPCPDCNGTGKAGGKSCVTCDGSGEVQDAADTKCTTCDGSGNTSGGKVSCPDCGGTGKMSDDADAELTDLIRRAYAPTALAPRRVRAVAVPPAAEPAPAAPVDIDTWRDMFASFRPAAKVDVGMLTEAIRTGVGISAVNQPENQPAPAAPVDLGPAPVKAEPEPTMPRNPIAELISGAVDLAAKNRPEPENQPVPVQHDDNPPLQLDVAALRRAVKESRF